MELDGLDGDKYGQGAALDLADEKSVIVLPDIFRESFSIGLDWSMYGAKAVYVIVLIILSVWATKATKYMFRRPEGGIRSGLVARANLIVPTLIWTATFATILYMLNVSWGSVAIVLGGASVGASFALGPLMSNIASAYINVLDGAFREGEVVKLSDGSVGFVNEIGLYSTEVVTPYEEIRVPNSYFRDGVVTNLSRRPGYREDIIVPIDDPSLGSDQLGIDKLNGIFDRLVADGAFDLYDDGFGNKLEEVRKADWGYYNIHGEALQIAFRLWATDPMAFFQKRHDFLERFMRACEEAEISYGYTANIASPKGVAVKGENKGA